MGKKIIATANGTGADLYLGLGFWPDKVTVENMEGTSEISLEWKRQYMRVAEREEGLLIRIPADITTALALDTTNTYTDAAVNTAVNAAVDAAVNAIVNRSPLTNGSGISLYSGGPAGAATGYYKIDATDKRSANTSLSPVSRWALDTAGSRTGSFDFGVNTTYVGEGSEVLIREDATGIVQIATITSISNDGDADDEVTLSKAVKDGDVQFLGPMYDFALVASGAMVPKGILISNTTVNVSGNTLLITAETID